MASTSASSDPAFDVLVTHLAETFAARLSAAMPRGAAGAGNGVSKLRGRGLDMRCRYPGCKNQSKGPRIRFFCDKPRKLPKKEQDVALAKWEKKNG